jgi:outer membrane protein TolC
MKKLLIVLLLTCPWWLPGQAPTSLDSVLAIIETEHPELKAYDARIRAGELYASGARAQMPPEVGAGLFMTPYNVRMWSSEEGRMDSPEGMGSFAVSAQQMFTHPRKLVANAAVMRAMPRVDRAMQGSMRNELFGMAKMRYAEWQILERRLLVLQENAELLGYLVKNAETRYTYGMDQLNAYYKAKAMLADVENMQLMTRSMIDQQRTALNTLLQRNQSAGLTIDTTLQLREYIDPAAPTEAASQRSGYRVLEENLQVVRLRQAQEQAALLPDFGLRFEHMFAFGQQPAQFTLMGMVRLPLAPWSARMNRANVQGLQVEQEALRQQQAAFLNATTGDAASLVGQMRYKREQLRLYESSLIPALRRNYQTTLLAYEQNTNELFMALDAWQNLKTAQLGYLDLLDDLLQLQVQYETVLEIR